jgi:hypothetical protein
MSNFTPSQQTELEFGIQTCPRWTAVKDAVRLYFDLARADARIPDEEGIEVSDADEARIIILKVIEDLYRTDPYIGAEWAGWRLDITTAWGTVILSIDLDSISP